MAHVLAVSHFVTSSHASAPAIASNPKFFDIYIGGNSSGYNHLFTVVGTTVFFQTDDGTNGAESWMYDMTGALGDSVMVKDINPDGDSYPRWFTLVGSTLICIAYTAATGFEMRVFDARSTQVIPFTGPDDRFLSSTPFDLTATASSSLTVTLMSSTTSVCTISGFTVTMLTTGTCTLVASQSGDGSYIAAPSVTQSLTITAAPTTTMAPTTTVPVIQVVTVPAATLPQTGSDSTSPLVAGMMVLIGGVVLMVSRRRASL